MIEGKANFHLDLKQCTYSLLLILASNAENWRDSILFASYG